MLELAIIGFVAGIVCGVSPCILPVLPVVLVAGAGGPTPCRGFAARPVWVVGGLVASFSAVILAGSEIISSLGLPQAFLRDAGITLLAVVGASFLLPPLSTLLERPFAHAGAWQPRSNASGFVVGLALGLVFVPCAGPILSAITVAGATHRVGWKAVLLTIAFGLGVAVPLLLVAAAGGQLAQRAAALRRNAPRIRRISGVVVLVMALTIGLNTFTGLQKDLPGYTTVGQTGSHVRQQLASIEGERTPGAAGAADLAKCSSTATALVNCGPAPNFAGITAWLNTPSGSPLSLAQLRGKVVLVDFWTYSCINCQRALPHVEAWYQDYARDGFVVVGVHTPEFNFEHVVSNVESETASLGVKYPVAIDDDYKTWDAYDNEYWPADYLIDARGDVRHVSFGEGGYSDTERLIRQLLTAAHPSIVLPAATDVANTTPAGEQSPETYVGYQQEQYIVNPTLTKNAAATYHFPLSVPLGALALGGTWTEGAQEATAGPGAQLRLGFLAKDVYLVMGGAGTVRVSINGKPTKTIQVRGVPRLYTLFQAPSKAAGALSLLATPGVQAYDFTFG